MKLGDDVVDKVVDRTLTEHKIQAIKDAMNIQSQDGNWNFNEYMVGMYNGMEFALSIIEDRHPRYLEIPKD